MPAGGVAGVRHGRRRGQDLLELLEKILVAERSGPEIFATLIAVTRPAGAPHISVQRAGHPGFLVRSSAGVRLEEVPGGPALGIVPDWDTRWPVVRVPVENAGAVMLFTDGLIEGRIGSGSDRLDEDGLLDIARRHNDLPADAFVDTLIHTAQSLAAHSGAGRRRRRTPPRMEHLLVSAPDPTDPPTPEAAVAAVPG